MIYKTFSPVLNWSSWLTLWIPISQDGFFSITLLNSRKLVENFTVFMSHKKQHASITWMNLSNKKYLLTYGKIANQGNEEKHIIFFVRKKSRHNISPWTLWVFNNCFFTKALEQTELGPSHGEGRKLHYYQLRR